ncbi:MAG: D-alanine--D-alanine ligase [Deltaproteobacteria bacterium]|nr:D-alanine--D-alanine ligase [Deltaproteobacteria bacterium]MBN2671376.1 D-alanine--D-alanine ligase [Deltaproteobacteria bacterium]
MRIGLTYDLRDDYLALGYSHGETAEFDAVETIDSIESALKVLGYETDRIGNIWRLTQRLADGDRWDLVFNIAEGLYGIAREAQVPALLDAYQIPYVFSDPFVLSLTLHKGMAKRVFRDMGIPTADFVEIRSLEELNNVSLPFPLFAKPIAEGTGKGISQESRITCRSQLETVCGALLTQYNQPVLLETYLPGREFTVGITGTGDNAKSVGVIEIVLGTNAEKFAYSFENKENWKGRVTYRPVNDAEAKRAEKTALDAWTGIHCRDGGRVDLRSDENGVPNVIEINPLAGIRPEYSDLPIICDFYGIAYNQLIKQIVDSALERVLTKAAFVHVSTKDSRHCA